MWSHGKMDKEKKGKRKKGSNSLSVKNALAAHLRFDVCLFYPSPLDIVYCKPKQNTELFRVTTFVQKSEMFIFLLCFLL